MWGCNNSYGAVEVFCLVQLKVWIGKFAVGTISDLDLTQLQDILCEFELMYWDVDEPEQWRSDLSPTPNT